MHRDMKLGNIVKLRSPYKPEDNGNAHHQEMFNRLHSRRSSEARAKAYQQWPGFTYGIVVSVIPSGTHRGCLNHFSLHLYDPLLGLLYMHKPDEHPIPMYVDFQICELDLVTFALNVTSQA